MAFGSFRFACLLSLASECSEEDSEGERLRARRLDLLRPKRLVEIARFPYRFGGLDRFLEAGLLRGDLDLFFVSGGDGSFPW